MTHPFGSRGVSALGATALGLAFCIASAQARSWRLNAEGTGDFATIHDALAGIADGDSILVEPGLYTWENQRVDEYPDPEHGMIAIPPHFPPNDIVIYGLGGPGQTIFDAQQQGRVFYSEGESIAGDPIASRFTLERITFRNGDTTSYPGANGNGGGIFIHLSTSTFRDCIISNNRAVLAGGILAAGQNSFLFERCIIRGNRADFSAGVQSINSDFEGVFRDCLFEDNVAAETGGGAYGIHTPLTFERCAFIGNTAGGKGSAIASRFSKPLIGRELFVYDNRGPGAAINADYRTGEPPPPVASTRIEIYDSLIADNDGGGIRFEANVSAVVSCTNVFGSPLGQNWQGNAQPFLGSSGNVSLIPHFCSSDASDGLVCDLSPVLAANNAACETDMGMTEPGCTGCEVIGPPTAGIPTVGSPFPNPFRSESSFEYQLPSAARVRVSVYDLRGRWLNDLVDADQPAGPHSASWDGTDDTGSSVGSGIYICRFEAGGTIAQHPMVLVR